MHDLEPYYNWRGLYIASEDPYSPFYEREYSEFEFTDKIYNHYIHPQWDSFGSQTLFMKILFVDYEDGYAIMEFIGEWNDLLYNDIMLLKREIIEHLMQYGISKYILLGENVLNFHSSDDCYYEEWFEEVNDEDGRFSICQYRQLLRTRRHAQRHALAHPLPRSILPTNSVASDEAANSLTTGDR